MWFIPITAQLLYDQKALPFQYSIIYTYASTPNSPALMDFQFPQGDHKW